MNDETRQALIAYTMAWCKETHPDWYELTLKVAKKPKSFNEYLIRLLERRWAEDPESRAQAPILGLEESSIIVKTKMDGQVVEFAGKKVKGRQRAIRELLMDKDEWVALEKTRQALDLEYEKDG